MFPSGSSSPSYYCSSSAMSWHVPSPEMSSSSTSGRSSVVAASFQRRTKSGVVHRKKCRHPKTPADLLRRYCLVCGCKAENYNFGVISCESCKAFFRRNAHKKFLGAAGFACSYRLGGCDVNAASRKKCPGCRLAKCFAVGMQADLIQKADQVDSPQPPHLEPRPRSEPDPGDHLIRLWQQLQSVPADSSEVEACSPAYGSAGSLERHSANILLIDFFDELRRLVRDTMLCDIAPVSDFTSFNGVALLEAFVHQSARFIAGLRQIDRLERGHFVALLRCRLHTVLLPLSCAGFSHLDGRFYFTVGGRRLCCQPIELFCDLVRQSSSRLVDYTPLAEFDTYTKRLLDLTEMRPELLALFCATKVLRLPPDCDASRLDDRLRGACDRLADRYHEHLMDSLFYHYPFEYNAKVAACRELLQWSLEFDRTLENFIQHCPLTGRLERCSS